MRAVISGLVLALALAGCGSSSSGSSGAAGSGGSGGSSATGGTGGAGGSGAGHRTLANCTTNIAPDAPELFKRYFRCVTVTTSAGSVTIQTDDLPPHETNYYGKGNPDYVPFDTSRGSQYHANPNLLSKQNIKVTIPLSPVAKGLTVTAAMVDGVVGTSSDEYPMGPAGVALDSVALFNPLAKPGDNIANERFTFDDYNAHPTQNGIYHYHTASPGPMEVLVAAGLDTSSKLGAGQPELMGIMCDGTLVLGCTELDGSTPSGPLDAQGGHVGDIVDKDGTVLAKARYHVHVCPSSATGRQYTPEIQYYTTCQR